MARCLEHGANAFVTKSPKYQEFRQSVSRIAGFWNIDNRVPKPAVLTEANCHDFGRDGDSCKRWANGERR